MTTKTEKAKKPCLFNNQELADHLDVSQKWLQRNRNGYHGIILPYTRVGKNVVYHSDDVYAAMEKAVIPAADKGEA